MGTVAETVSERTPSGPLYGAAAVWRVERPLPEIDTQAKNMFIQLVEQTAEQEGITEQLKTDKPMEWVGRMNNIRQRAEEIVNMELICS